MDASEAVPVDVTRSLIENHLQAWRAKLEDWRIAMAVSDAIGESEDRKEMIRKESIRCVKAIEKLMAMLSELPNA